MHLPASPSNAKAGFTLVELLLAATLSAIVLISFFNGFNQQQQVLKRKKLEQEMQFNVRNAISFLERDLSKSAGGLVMGEQNLDTWFSSLTGITSIPHIVDGGTGPDSLIIAGAQDAPVATLDGTVSAGAVQIRITPETGNAYTYSPRVGDVLVLGGVEAVLVTGVLGNQLTVKANPTAVVGGIQLDYPDDIDIFLITVVEYGIETINGVTGLTREDSRYTYASTEDRLVAEGIEDLQLRKSNNVVTVEVSGVTRHPVLNYTEEADGHPRYVLTSNVKIQVVSPQLNISSWPENTLVGTPTPSSSATPTVTATPSATATPGPTATPGAPPTATPTVAPTSTPVPVPSATPTPRHKPGQKKNCWCAPYPSIPHSW